MLSLAWVVSGSWVEVRIEIHGLLGFWSSCSGSGIQAEGFLGFRVGVGVSVWGLNGGSRFDFRLQGLGVLGLGCWALGCFEKNFGLDWGFRVSGLGLSVESFGLFGEGSAIRSRVAGCKVYGSGFKA